MTRRLFGVVAFASGFMGLRAQQREGNYDIRFEPTAKLQTGTQVPFQITVKDALRKPLPRAQVLLQIEDKDGLNVQQFPAPEVAPGIYIAKPVFRAPGEWSVYVEVRRNGAMSARTIQFQVAE